MPIPMHATIFNNSCSYTNPFAESKGKNDPTIKIVIGATITVFFLSLLVIIVLLLLKILKKAPRRQEGTMRV